jgi:hypothetical protein
MKRTVFNVIIPGLLIIGACQNKKEETNQHQHQHDSTSAPIVQTDTIKKSIPKEEHAQVGPAHVMIKYHAPAVRGRTIWGGLVTYGDVWVTGAHSATSFETDKTLIVGAKEIAAGKYALFTIPGKDKWIIIINKNWDQHLTDEYDQKDDLVRIEVTPEELPNVQERLRYTIAKVDDSKGSVDFSWEKIKVSMPFAIK